MPAHSILRNASHFPQMPRLIHFSRGAKGALSQEGREYGETCCDRLDTGRRPHTSAHHFLFYEHLGKKSRSQKLKILHGLFDPEKLSFSAALLIDIDSIAIFYKIVSFYFSLTWVRGVSTACRLIGYGRSKVHLVH